MSHHKGHRVKSRSKTISLGRGPPSVKVVGEGRAEAGRETVVVGEVEENIAGAFVRVMFVKMVTRRKIKNEVRKTREVWVKVVIAVLRRVLRCSRSVLGLVVYCEWSSSRNGST